MGQYTNNVILDRIICESHDRWITRTPDYYDIPEEDEEDITDNEYES